MIFPINKVFGVFAEIKIPATVHVTKDTMLDANVQDFLEILEFTINQAQKET
jgi:hypothetical protein